MNTGKKYNVNVQVPDWFKATFNRQTLGKGGKQNLKSILIPFLITLVIGLARFYKELPALNIKSPSFWGFLLSELLIYIFVKAVYLSVKKEEEKHFRIPVILAVIVVLILVLGTAFSARIFHAKAYSRILTVTEGSVEDIPSQEGSDAIALMDTSSAQMLGDREIGSLTNLVSQFNVGSYIQIDYSSRPVKVAALCFDGFFKWMGNREHGIPGYVVVDPVDMDADYVSLETGMKYVPSAWFQRNLGRQLRFHYPTLMFRNVHFEIDEEGKPWYIAPYYTYTVGLFGGEQVMGAVIADPVTGEMTRYASAELPGWVDVIYDGDLICLQYNDAAQLQNGFLNTLFGQKDCRRVTTMSRDDDEETLYPDFGYIAKGGDIWIYTGVTSVNGDSSNLGFILSNERTEETRFITCAGADEFSAMRSAEGEVQEKAYKASFPSLINVDNIPTYIMVLKDANGLVKMYAAVNVSQYNMVATASTQKACIEKYNMLVRGEISADQAVKTEEAVPEVDTSAFTEKQITISKIETIVQQGNTYIYIVDEENQIYHARYADVIGMILHDEGDELTILTDGTHFLLPEE